MEDDLRWKMTFGGEATSKQGRKLRFGILTVLIITDQSRCYGRWKTAFGGEATSKQGRKLRFGMLTVLTNIRSIKVLW